MNLNPRIIWAAAYALANVAAFVLILSNGELIGDLSGFRAPPFSDLLSTLALVCCSIFVLLAIFTILTRVQFRHIKSSININRVRVFITVLLISFIVYVSATGLFIAGSSARGGSFISALFVIFNIDTLFFIYYATCRETRGFKINLLLWMASFLQRGWFAYLFFIIGMESFRLIREKRIFRWKVFFLLIFFVAAYPLLDVIKVYIRETSSISLTEFFAVINNSLSDPYFSWTSSSYLAAEKIIGRIQILSHAQVITDNSKYFNHLSENTLNPFWKEGLVGLIFSHLIGNESGLEPGQALALFINPYLDSSWNVNPSLVGWLSMQGDSLPLAMIYIIVLCIISAWLHQQITRSQSSFDRLWFIWLTLLIPGWIAQFIFLIVAQIIVIIILKAPHCFKKQAVSAYDHCH